VAAGGTDPKDKTRRTTGKSKAERSKPAKPDTPSVPGARLSAYAEEAAELLAGLSPDRRRRKTDRVERRAPAGDASTEPAKD
jgi:hypothetical protein